MNLYVGNLSPETTEDDLVKLFSEFGKVLSSKVLRDMETGLPRGFGFVEMAEKYESFDAVDNIDGIYFKGNVISVKEAKGKTTGGPGGRPQSRGGSSGGSGGFSPRPRKPFNRL